MMEILDRERYLRHRVAGPGSIGMTALLFGSIGAIAWATRGSGGWDGIDGTLVPGMTWGLLWYYVCLRRGIDARGIPLWLCLGIAIGGEWGYGQYTGWIRGRFSYQDAILPVAPWVGYVWFIICGIAWGAPGGILLGWALGGRASVRIRIARLGFPLFAAWLGWLIVQKWPGLFFPNHGMGIYEGEPDRHLDRTVYTNTQNFGVLAWYVGAMLVAAFQKDRNTLVAGGVIGGGFGFGFMVSALWCLGYGRAPSFIDWWKLWELNAGLFLGALYVVVLFWAMKQVDLRHDPEGKPRVESEPVQEGSNLREWGTTVFLGLGVYLFFFYTFADHFRPTGILLGIFYCIAMIDATRADLSHSEPDRKRRRKEITLLYSWFLLLFILLHGSSSRATVILGLSDQPEVNQYKWPTERIGLFALFAVPLVLATVYSMARIIWGGKEKLGPTWGLSLSDRMILIFAGVALAGAISIEPGKIAPFYALFLLLTLYAFASVKRRFDRVDGIGSEL